MELSKGILEAKGEIRGRDTDLGANRSNVPGPHTHCSVPKRGMPFFSLPPICLTKNPVEEFLLAWMLCPTLWPRRWSRLIGSPSRIISWKDYVPRDVTVLCKVTLSTPSLLPSEQEFILMKMYPSGIPPPQKLPSQPSLTPHVSPAPSISYTHFT